MGGRAVFVPPGPAGVGGAAAVSARASLIGGVTGVHQRETFAGTVIFLGGPASAGGVAVNYAGAERVRSVPDPLTGGGGVPRVTVMWIIVPISIVSSIIIAFGFAVGFPK